MNLNALLGENRATQLHKQQDSARAKKAPSKGLSIKLARPFIDFTFYG